MPLESLIIVGTILSLFVAFAATLAWARWYAGDPPRSAKESAVPEE
jgi:hypothetical protein